ncbi:MULTISPECIES: hypothetical protein [Enterobacteriaceae]|nr:MULTISPECIES: hypothetical protein [Enterobacteriaceae]
MLLAILGMHLLVKRDTYNDSCRIHSKHSVWRIFIQIANNNKRNFHEQYSTYAAVRDLCLKNRSPLRITVTDVDIVDDSPDDELFYLVRRVEGEDESDMSAMEFELDPVEWQAFVESEKLVFERDPYMDSVPENSNLAKIRDLLMKTKQNDRS